MLRWLPPIEYTIMLLGLLATAVAKFLVVRQYDPSDVFLPVVRAIVPDVIFFATVALAFSIVLMWDLRGLASRATLLAALLVLGWSVLNAAWLVTSGVQLQPGVLRVLLASSGEMWPMVYAYVTRNVIVFAPVMLVTLGAVGWLLWRFVKPAASLTRSRCFQYARLSTITLVAALIALPLSTRGDLAAYSGQVIGFSSHWYALRHIAGEPATLADLDAPQRALPRIGERVVGLPDAAPEEMPNVVIVLLESVYQSVTSMADPSLDLTPFLAQLASEGAEFSRTRVPMPQTTKAFWAALTGSMPEVRSGYAEAILADQPFESLASILRRAGYRSAFYQMSTGRFECLPAVFANLDFDWAWFPENLGDPSTALTMLSGDDFAMIPSMFEWVDQGDEPFLLMTITSVSHDPFIVPEWYEPNQSRDRYERFLTSVRFNDDFLKEIVAQLEERNLLENTLIVVQGDHGESFRPQSRRGRWAVFEELLHVPWVLYWPNRIEAGQRYDWPCSQLDITPTILNTLGFDISEAGFEGVDCFEPQPHDRRIWFSSWYPRSPMGYVEGDRKLMYWPSIDQVFEYDLLSDPGEESPRVVESPEKERIIRETLEWKASTQFDIPAKRFRDELLYDHWRVFSSGRTGRSYFVPSHEEKSTADERR